MFCQPNLPLQFTETHIKGMCIRSCSNNSTIVQSCDCLLVVGSNWNKFYIFWLNRSILSLNSVPRLGLPGTMSTSQNRKTHFIPALSWRAFWKERKQNSNSSREAAASERDSRATELKQSGTPAESIKAPTYQYSGTVVTAGKDSLPKRTEPDDHTVKISGQN